MIDEYLTIKQVGEILKVHPRTVNRLIEEGLLIAKDIGMGKERKIYRVKRSDIDKIDLSNS